MGIQWTDDLATGINIIDKQHKELFIKINSLIEAMSKGRGKDEIGNTIKFLGDYVVMHFGTEEKIMVEKKYPDFTNHKAEHQGLIDDFLKIKDEFLKNGASSTLSIEVQSRIGNWLINHIGKVDKALGKYLKEIH